MAKQADLFPFTSTPVALERARIEAEIQEHLDAAEAAIAALDASEPDADLEGGGDDEPDVDGENDLGWPEQMNQTKALKACVGFGAANDLEEDTADNEPSLGSPLAAMHDQTYWARGSTTDLEQDCEDEGADEGAEYVTSLRRYIPPTKGDVKAAKVVRGFLQRVTRDGRLGAKVPVTAICIPAREDFAMTAADLIARHRAAMGLWSQLLKATESIPQPELPRVQTGYVDRGEEREFIYAYSLQDIERQFEPFIKASRHFTEKTARGWEARREAKQTEWLALKREYDQIRAESGRAAAEEADEAHAAIVDDTLLALLAHVPATLDEAAAAAGYILALGAEVSEERRVRFLRAVARADGKRQLRRVA